jgi:hypothetical protein
MKNPIIPVLLLAASACFGATVDRTETILATGTNKNTAGTAIVSQSPTNEYAIGVYTVILGTNAASSTSFSPAYTVAPIQISLSAGQTSNTVSAISTSAFTVTNTAPYITTNNFLFLGVKRLGVKQ